MRAHSFALLLAAVLVVNADTYSYGNVAIGGGGFVTGIVVSKLEKNLAYARTDVGGAYRWNGSKWIPLLDWVSEADVGLMGVESIALDPNDAARVYMLAGTSYFSSGKTAILRSSDYGATFQSTVVTSQFTAHGNGMGRQTGEKLIVDPGSSKILYCGTRDKGLFKSTDYGATWTKVSTLSVSSTSNGNGISFVMADPTSVSSGVAQRIFVGVSTSGTNLYVSTNAGSSWTAVSGAPTSYAPHSAVFTSNNELIITYANAAGPWDISAGAVYKYSISTGTWTAITPSYSGGYGGVDVNPSNANMLVVSTINIYGSQGDSWGDQIFRSTDGGKTWTNLMASGFSKTFGGVSWIQGGYAIHWVGCLRFDPFDNKAVWAISGNGVWKTSDVTGSSVAWAFAVAGLEETVPLGIVSIEGGSLVSVIGDYDGFVHSNIDSYGPIHSPAIGTTGALDVAGTNSNYQVRIGKSMYYTKTGSSGWTLASSVKGSSGQVAIAADGSSILHTPDSTSVTYRTTNWGSSWTQVSGLSTGRVVADRVNAKKFYAYDSGKFMVSTDGGATFSQTATLSSGGSYVIRTVPGKEGHIWVPLKSGGLYRSTNSGSSFTSLGVAVANAVGLGKAATGASYYTVYIWGQPTSSSTLGVYRSINEGSSWTRVNDDTHQFGGPGNGEFVIGDMNTYGLWYMSTVGRGIVYGKIASTSTPPTPTTPTPTTKATPTPTSKATPTPTTKATPTPTTKATPIPTSKATPTPTTKATPTPTTKATPTPTKTSTSCTTSVPLWGNCLSSPKCCAQGTCYGANQWYAQCRLDCVGISGWTCTKLS